MPRSDSTNIEQRDEDMHELKNTHKRRYIYRETLKPPDEYTQTEIQRHTGKKNREEQTVTIISHFL